MMSENNSSQLIPVLPFFQGVLFPEMVAPVFIDCAGHGYGGIRIGANRW